MGQAGFLPFACFLFYMVRTAGLAAVRFPADRGKMSRKILFGPKESSIPSLPCVFALLGKPSKKEKGNKSAGKGDGNQKRGGIWHVCLYRSFMCGYNRPGDG